MPDEDALAVRALADDDRVARANVAAVLGQLVQVLADGDLVRPAREPGQSAGLKEASRRARGPTDQAATPGQP